MKTRGLKIGKLVSAIMLLFFLTFLAAPKTTNAQMQISFQMFYDQLSPYGQWFQDPQYGYVWAPNVGNDFRPYYTNGYWMMTQYGNMWMSDYAWGWAPFHYGRWTFNPRFGWIWIPGMEWGPAWVVWRHGAGNYGWAPMGPGVSIHMSFGNNYYSPHDWWTFIPMNYIYHRNFHRYYAPRNTINIYNRTTIINNTYIDRGTRTTYVTGPRRNEVERATRSRVDVYNVGTRRDVGNSTLNGRNVNVYRPRVTDNGARGSASPRNATRMENSIVTVPSRESNVRDRSRNTRTNTVTPNTNTRQAERSNVNVTPNRNNQTERNVAPAQPQRQNNNVERNTAPRIQNREDVNRNRQQQRVTPQNNRNNTQPQRSSNVQPNSRGSVQPQRNNSVQQNRSTNVRSSNERSSRSSSVSSGSSQSSRSSAPARNSSSRSEGRGR